MSLEDELSEHEKSTLTTEVWLERWVATLSAKDQRTWHAWLSDPTKPAAVLYRVIHAHGYPRKASVFRHWVKEYRESLG